jgi:hypothetical protein
MRPDELFESIGRGIVKQLLAPEAAANDPAAMLPAKAEPSGVVVPPEASVIPGEVPQPSFDQVDEPLPGFEGIPRATLKQMQDAMEKITRGQGPPPGMYDKDDPNNPVNSVPLS